MDLYDELGDAHRRGRREHALVDREVGAVDAEENVDAPCGGVAIAVGGVIWPRVDRRVG